MAPRRSRLRKLVSQVFALLGVAAVVSELRKPADERTWQGRIAGVPYDFRRPTLARLRRSFWDAGDPRIVRERGWGVGWSLNLAALVQRARGAITSSSSS